MKNILTSHFPNNTACYVFRNWNIIPCQKIAEAIGVEKEAILEYASLMGLPIPERITADYVKKGFITVIRANWNILSNEQICTLLGWDMSELLYALKEDDFLNIKLGVKFNDDKPLIYEKPDEKDAKRYAQIKKAYAEFEKEVGNEKAAPFDFEYLFNNVSFPALTDYESKSTIKEKIIYSYCALYGDTFLSDTEYCFPDSLLRAYQAVGVTGVWCQAVLYKLVPYPFDSEMCNGWRERIANIRKLTKRLKKYGIKLYLYLNEPRSMPKSFFEKHPELKGADFGDECSLCVSNEKVKNYLFNAPIFILNNVPLLGGFFTITASENHTNCYSHFANHRTNCPNCVNRERAEVIAEVNALICAGTKEANKNARVIAWDWGLYGEEAIDMVSHLPSEISVMNVSEQEKEKVINGTKTSVADYSISVVGPGEVAKKVWKTAKERGMEAFAKCQLNNTWECGAIPFIPAYEQIYSHLCGIIKEKLDGIMLSWTLGGFPSPTLALASEMLRYDENNIPSLHTLYGKIFPSEAVDTVEEACHLFSAAFDEFPFDISLVYHSPHLSGSANLLYHQKTGMSSTMVGYPYDDISTWGGIFDEETAEKQFKALSEKWLLGLNVLNRLDKSQLDNSFALSLLFDSAHSNYCHFRSAYLQYRFVRIRDGRENGDLNEIYREEKELALSLAEIQSRNPSIGYESSNHYFYTRQSLAEKYISLS